MPLFSLTFIFKVSQCEVQWKGQPAYLVAKPTEDGTCPLARLKIRPTVDDLNVDPYFLLN